MARTRDLALPAEELTCREELAAPAGRPGLVLILPAAVLFLLAAVCIAREAGAVRPLYTAAMLAGLLALALLVRAAKAGPRWVWLALLFAGAAALRAVFALGWTVLPHEELLSEWNLALELSRAGPADWPALTAAAGFDGPLGLGLAQAVYESALIRLFGPTLLSVQLTGAVWGTLSCLLAALIGEKITGSRLSGLLAGAITAFCPTLLFSAGTLSAVPLYTALLLAGVWLLVCRPFAAAPANHALAGAAWGLGQVLCPGLPVPLIGAAAWLVLTLPGRRRDKALLLRLAALAAGFLALWLILGGLLGALTGQDALSGRLGERLAVGADPAASGQYTWQVRSGAEAAPKGGVPSLSLMAEKVRLTFTSFDPRWARLDGGTAARENIINTVMHPALQSYMLVVLLLAAGGVLALIRGGRRRALIPPALLLAGAGAAALLEAAPAANGWIIPLLALCAAPAGEKLGEWVIRMAAPETGKGRKKAPPLPAPLRAVRLVISVAVYAAMLALVLVFFTGNGVFIYEAF